MKRNIFCAVMMIAFVIFAALSLGGCGGSSSNSIPNSNNENNQTYMNDVASKLIAESTVYSLAEFLNNSSATVKKSEILLYHTNKGENITENVNYLNRINDALESGAIAAFVDITAEEIDKINNELGLDLPPYLPNDATEQEKAEIEDFYAIAARVDSDDNTIENIYTFYGTELHKPSNMDIHVYSGDEEIAFDPSESEEDTIESILYYTEDGQIVTEDPNPFKYDHVDDTVQDFFDWCDDLDSLKSISEAEAAGVSDSTVRSAAGSASATFPGVTTSFNFVQNYSPRKYYYKKGPFTHNFTHKKPWHRETSMAFNIVPVHSFNDGSDYYVVQVSGNTDPSKEYAHPSHEV